MARGQGTGLGRRLAWFAGLWLAGVLALGALVFLLRWAMGG